MCHPSSSESNQNEGALAVRIADQVSGLCFEFVPQYYLTSRL